MIEVKWYRCKDCGFYVPEQQGCSLHQKYVNPTEDFCSDHVATLQMCELCGKPIVPKNTVWLAHHILCSKCAQLATGTCVGCTHYNDMCYLTDDTTVTEPLKVRKTIRQGNMQMMTEVVNPERIRKTCEAKCFCFDAENGCGKQNGYCSKFDFIWKGDEDEYTEVRADTEPATIIDFPQPEADSEES